jgi:ubiquinone/menaquinone biosynthesis C-methylase UbiE
MDGAPTPSSMLAYYERRAPEYDDWYLGRGRFATRMRPGFRTEVGVVAGILSSLPATPTLDVGCGTGYMTRHLPGPIVGLDRSPGMLRVARRRVAGPLVVADALALPFRDGAFGRAFAGHVYGHLTPGRARRFVDGAFRVAHELVVLDSALRPDVRTEEVQERTLDDGSVHRVYKRYFAAEALAEELSSGEVLFDGRWFVLVRATRGANPHG